MQEGWLQLLVWVWHLAPHAYTHPHLLHLLLVHLLSVHMHTHHALHHPVCAMCCVLWCLLCRDKAPEEESMEQEVEELRTRLEGMKELTPGETDTIADLAKELDEKETALYKLQVRL